MNPLLGLKILSHTLPLTLIEYPNPNPGPNPQVTPAMLRDTNLTVEAWEASPGGNTFIGSVAYRVMTMAWIG